MADTLAADIERAVTLLYGSSGPQQKEADRWLRELQRSPQGWTLPSVLLVQSKPVEAQFFGARTLYHKIANDCDSVDEDQLIVLRDELLKTVLSYANGPRSVRNRLTQAVGALVLQSLPHAWQRPLENMSQLLPPEVLLLVLTAVAEEYNTATLTRQRKNEVRAALNDEAPRVLSFLALMLEPNQSETVRKDALKALQAWVDFGIPMPDVHVHIVLVIRALYTETMFDEAVDCLQGIFEAPGFERYPRTVFSIVPHLLPLRDIISRAAAAEDEDTVLGACRVLLSLGERHTRTILSPQNAEQMELTAQLATLVLDCTDFPGTCFDEKLSSSTLQFWYEFCETLKDLTENEDASAAVMVATFTPTLQRLLLVLRRKVQYPPEAFTPVWSANRQSEFKKLRVDYDDTMAYVHGVLGETAGNMFCQMLKSVCDPRPSWQEVESAIHCVRAVSDNVAMQSERDARWLPVALEMIVAMPTQPEPLLYEILLSLGAYAEWFKERPAQLSVAMATILPALATQGIAASAAANSFYDFCDACAEVLVASAETVWASALTALRSPSTKARDSTRIVRGLCAILSSMGAREVAAPYLVQLLEVPSTQLAACLQEGSAQTHTAEFVQQKLDLLSHILKETDVKGDEVEGPSIVLEAFAQVVPAVQYVLQQYAKDEHVVSSCCGVFSAVIRNIGHQFDAYLDPLLQLLTQSYQQAPQAGLLSLASVLAALYATGAASSRIFALYVSLSQTTLALWRQADMRENPDLVSAFFGFLSKLARGSPDILSGEPQLLTAVCNTALMAMHLPETVPAKAACTFIVCADAIANLSTAEAVQQIVPPLVNRIVQGIAGSVPRTQLGSLLDTLFALVRHMPTQFHQILPSTLASSAVPPHITDAQKQAFVVQLYVPYMVSKRQKKMIVDAANDFAVLCRRLDNDAGYR